MRDVVNTGWAEEEEERVFAFKRLMAMPTSDFVSLIKATQPLVLTAINPLNVLADAVSRLWSNNDEYLPAALKKYIL